jgi:asparagine synthase (glutamine-hydrolysing)
MCGIAGIIADNENNQLEKYITSMSDVIIHRGPDGFGYYHNDKFAFGHRRLAILDLTSNGAQPMEYLNKYVITYNGEIYNYMEIRKELIEKGYTFNSNTDTEVIIAAYDYWGKECLNKFNGMWAFALYDKEKNIVFCSRDRFGVKPFYYSNMNGNFAFASEIKQFTVLEGWRAVANKVRLIEYLWVGVTDHTNETLFEDVHQLRGGENLIFDLGNNTFRIEKWYDLSKKSGEFKLNFNESKEKFKELFSDSIKLRLRSDVKVGSCLSGGLDSSSIVCVANKLLKLENGQEKQETVSSCSVDKKYDEQEFIDEVINENGIKGHKVFPEYKELFETLDKLTWHQDEPFMSSSVYAQWEVFKGAKDNGIIVMLDGQGADEQLAGYNTFHTVYLIELMLKLKLATFVKSITSRRLFYREKYASQLKSLITMISINITPNSIHDSIREIKKQFLKKAKSFSHITNQSSIWKKRSKVFDIKVLNVKSESIKELLYTSLPKLLHYEDRNSMAHSVESRVPFIDYRIVEFVLSLPSEYKINDSKTKYILREAMQGILPENIVNRYDKMAFVTPEEIWIRENSLDFKNEIADACDRLNGLVDKEEALKWYEDAINSSQSFNYTFWKLISIGRWIKVFNVEIPKR